MKRRREFAIFFKRNWFFSWIFTNFFFISSTFSQSNRFRVHVVRYEQRITRSRWKIFDVTISFRIAIRALISSKVAFLNRIKIYCFQKKIFKKCESKTYWNTSLFLSQAFCTRDIVYTTTKYRNATTFNAIRKFVVVLVNEFIFIFFFNNESNNERFIKLRLNNVSTTRSFRNSKKSEKNDDIAKRHRDARDKRNEIARRDLNKNKKIIDYSTLLMIFHLSQKISTTFFFFSKKLIKIWKFILCHRFFCDDDNKFDHKNWSSNRKRICNDINDENIQWFKERKD